MTNDPGYDYEEHCRLQDANSECPDDDCSECNNSGRTVFGTYGGNVRFVNGCPECGREERDC